MSISILMQTTRKNMHTRLSSQQTKSLLTEFKMSSIIPKAIANSHQFQPIKENMSEQTSGTNILKQPIILQLANYCLVVVGVFFFNVFFFLFLFFFFVNAFWVTPGSGNINHYSIQKYIRVKAFRTYAQK